MPDTTALYDHRNWTAYLFSFRQSFKFLDPELTDPNRFPKDSRDGNGFWLPFKVYAVWGQFCCPVDQSCFWESKEVQVDVLYRYNFKTKLGEVKIDREYRQRCPEHGGKFVSPLVGDMGGAKWIMMKAQRSIMKKYYGGGLGVSGLFATRSRSRNSTGSSGDSSAWEISTSSGSRQGAGWNNSTSSSMQGASWDGGRHGHGGTERRDERRALPLYKPVPSHLRENCEACLLRRCPIPRLDIPDWEFMVAGLEINNRKNMTFITWCLIDDQDVPFDVFA